MKSGKVPADREPVTARLRPCASCPYRRDAPSGVWHQEEYDKLLEFDGSLVEQIEHGKGNALFYCHQSTTDDEHAALCAGWVGHRRFPFDLMGIRTGIATGRVDPQVLYYRTSVPLFDSGAEAAEHGMRDYEAPGPKASDAVRKITSNPRRPDLEFG